MRQQFSPVIGKGLSTLPGPCEDTLGVSASLTEGAVVHPPVGEGGNPVAGPVHERPTVGRCVGDPYLLPTRHVLAEPEFHGAFLPATADLIPLVTLPDDDVGNDALSPRHGNGEGRRIGYRLPVEDLASSNGRPRGWAGQIRTAWSLDSASPVRGEGTRRFRCGGLCARPSLGYRPLSGASAADSRQCTPIQRAGRPVLSTG